MNSNFNLEKIFNMSIDQVDSISQDMESNVYEMSVPKKDGSKRKIIAPCDKLKHIQKNIYYKIFMRYRPSKNAHGFVRKRGIVTNAKQHLDPKSFGHLDIRNFFDTISEDHIKQYVFGNKNICRLCKNYEKMLDGECHPSMYQNKNKKFSHRCEELKAIFLPEYCEKTGYKSLYKYIIKLCTYKGHTVQGFTTSPVIANIVLNIFDKILNNFCTKRNITYTRYADDLAFSSKVHNKKALEKILKEFVTSLIIDNNFEVNNKKTFWKSGKGYIKICGVVVDKNRICVPRYKVRHFRARVHYATVKFKDETSKSKIRSLKGYASYIMSVDPGKGNRYMSQLKNFESENKGSLKVDQEIEHDEHLDIVDVN